MTQPATFVHSGPFAGIVVFLAILITSLGGDHRALAMDRGNGDPGNGDPGNGRGAEREQVGSILGPPTRTPRTRRVSGETWLRMVQNAAQTENDREPPVSPPEIEPSPFDSPRPFAPAPGYQPSFDPLSENWDTDEEPMDDPTRPSPPLREVLEAEAVPPDAPMATRQMLVDIPEIQVKARVVVGSQAEALLEVDGRLLRVAEGDELRIRGASGGLLRLHVQEIHDRGVRLQFPPIPGEVTY